MNSKSLLQITRWCLAVLLVIIFHYAYVQVRGSSITIMEGILVNVLWLLIPLLVKVSTPKSSYETGLSRFESDIAISITLSCFVFGLIYIAGTLSILSAYFFLLTYASSCPDAAFICVQAKRLPLTIPTWRVTGGSFLLNLFILPIASIFSGLYYTYAMSSKIRGIAGFAITYTVIYCGVYLALSPDDDAFLATSKYRNIGNVAPIIFFSAAIGISIGALLARIFSSGFERAMIRQFVSSRYDMSQNEKIVEKAVAAALGIDLKRQSVKFRIVDRVTPERHDTSG